MDREIQYLARQFVFHGSSTSEEFACDLAVQILTFRRNAPLMLKIATALGGYLKPEGGDGE